MEVILSLQAGQGDFHVFLMVAGREPETNWWYTFGFESEEEFESDEEEESDPEWSEEELVSEEENLFWFLEEEEEIEEERGKSGEEYKINKAHHRK